ncbi:hypothetical protein AHAS_Ahas17G0198000 [Arachis hypogaea]
MAPKSAAMKNLRTTRKSAVARNLQLQETGGVASHSKSDSGVSASVKIVPDPAWSDKHMLPHIIISIDDVAIESHLHVMARGGVQTIGLYAALLKELKKTSLGTTQSTLVKLQAEVESLRKTKKELESKKETLEFDLSKAREKVK